MDEQSVKVPPNNSTIYADSVDYMRHLQEYEIGEHEKFKILCWTNKRALQMNKLIRNFLYGAECERFCENELLIAKDHFTLCDKTFTSNQELYITEVIKQNKITLSEYVPKLYLNGIPKPYVRCWKLLTKDGDEILVVDKRYEKVINFILQKIEKNAQAYVNEKQFSSAKVLWKLYYSIKDRFMPPIDYYYAITIHRSQGSEWDEVYIEYSDVIKNRRKNERVKLFYVACSRAINKIIIHN